MKKLRQSLSSSTFYLLADESILNHRLIRKAVAEIARKGFRGIWINIRYSNYTVRSREVVSAFKTTVKEAHRNDMKAFISLHLMESDAKEFLQIYPQSHLSVLVKQEAEIKNGIFKTYMTYPGGGFSLRHSIYEGIERIFLVTKYRGHKIYRYQDVTNKIKYDLNRITRVNLADGIIFSQVMEIKGTFGGKGKLVFWGRFGIGNPDYAARGYRKYSKMLLDLHAASKADGVWWDEPGFRPQWDFELHAYSVSNDLLERFRKTNRYDLREKLLELEYEVVGRSKSKVRYDYYTCLRDILYNAQMNFKKESKNIFGKDMEFGIHHTWMECASLDLGNGSIDYLHLADTLTGGFTDSYYLMDDSSSIWGLTLAKSAAKKLNTTHAYNNSWNFDVTYEEYDYFSCLMALFQVGWIGHAYGESGFGSGWPHHYTWGLIQNITGRLNRISDFVGGAKRIANIAVVHSWESTALDNTSYSHIHRYSSQKLVRVCTLYSHLVDLVSNDMIGNGRVVGNKLYIAEEEYDIIILPWPSLLPEKTWDNIRTFGENGGRLVLYGPSLVELTNGKDRSKEFSEFVRIKLIGQTNYKTLDRNRDWLELVTKKGKVKKVRTKVDGRHPFEIGITWFTHGEPKFRFVPLKPKGSKVIVRRGKDVLAVRNDNIYYFSFDFPIYPDIVKDLLNTLDVKRKIIIPQGGFYQLYKDGDKTILLVTARRKKKLNGSISVEGQKVQTKGLKFLALKFDNNKIIDILEEH